MTKPLRVLIVEDSAADAELLLYHLQQAGYQAESERVDTAQDMANALAGGAWDLVLADYNLPQFSAPDALGLVQDRELDLPFIVVSGAIGEESAVALLKAGAHDFIVKQNLSRLVPAIERELREASMRRERKRAEEEVQLLHKLGLAISEAEDFERALGVVLNELCSAAGWIYGEAWVPDAETNELKSSPVWYSMVDGLESFASESATHEIVRGSGLVGRAWDFKQLVWIKDVSQDVGSGRLDLAQKYHLKAGVAVPVVASDEVVAILAFFMFEARDEDAHFVNLASVITAQLGSLIRRKRMEQALRESQALFQSFMNNTPAIAFMKDEQGRYTYVNERFERQFRTKLADVHGKTDFMLLPPGTARQLQQDDSAVLRSNKTIEMFEAIPTPDGRTNYWWVFKFPFLDAGGKRYVGTVAIDVTERRGPGDSF